MRRVLLVLLSVLGLTLATTPAQATHTYEESCTFGTSIAPTKIQNATRDGSIVIAAGKVLCHEGDPLFASHHVTEMYIHISLQIRSLAGIWYTRDTASARWTGAIGNTPPTVTANLSDACVNTANRKHRIRYDDVWYRTGDGAIHQLSQGAYSGDQPFLTCGH